jgi:flagellar FliJ protein
MKRFRFSLDPLLQIRKRTEEEAKQALAAKKREIAREREAMAELAQQLALQQQQQMQQRQHNSERVDAMRAGVLFRFACKSQMMRTGARIDTLYAEADALQYRLTKATQQRRAIELLREKRFNEWKREANRQEQIFIDDVSQQGYIRKQRMSQA